MCKLRSFHSTRVYGHVFYYNLCCYIWVDGKYAAFQKRYFIHIVFLITCAAPQDVSLVTPMEEILIGAFQCSAVDFDQHRLIQGRSRCHLGFFRRARVCRKNYVVMRCLDWTVQQSNESVDNCGTTIINGHHKQPKTLHRSMSYSCCFPLEPALFPIEVECPRLLVGPKPICIQALNWQALETIRCGAHVALMGVISLPTNECGCYFRGLTTTKLPRQSASIVCTFQGSRNFAKEELTRRFLNLHKSHLWKKIFSHFQRVN